MSVKDRIAAISRKSTSSGEIKPESIVPRRLSQPPSNKMETETGNISEPISVKDRPSKFGTSASLGMQPPNIQSPAKRTSVQEDKEISSTPPSSGLSFKERLAQIKAESAPPPLPSPVHSGSSSVKERLAKMKEPTSDKSPAPSVSSINSRQTFHNTQEPNISAPSVAALKSRQTIKMSQVFGVQSCSPGDFIDFCDVSEGITVSLVSASAGWNSPSSKLSWFSSEDPGLLEHTMRGYLEANGKRYELIPCPQLHVSNTGSIDDFQSKITAAIKLKCSFDPLPVGSESSSDEWLFYCLPQHVDALCNSSLRVKGKDFRCSRISGSQTPPILQPLAVAQPPPQLHPRGDPRPPAPQPAAPALLPPSPPYHIEIFHDGENCTCVGSASAVEVYNKLIRAVLRAYLGNEDLANNIDIIAHLQITWNFVLSKQRQNAFNQPSPHFLEEFIRKGVTSIDAGRKNSAVDTSVSHLMRKFEANYEDLSAESKRKRIVVVLSGDSDVIQSITGLRRKGFPVMLVWNLAEERVSPALLDSVPHAYRLGNWYQLTGIVPALDSDHPSPMSAPRPVVAPMMPGNVRNIFLVAEFILMQCKDAAPIPDRPWSVYASTIGSFYSKYPAMKGVISEAGGLLKFCQSSEGGIEWHTPPLAGTMTVSLPGMANLLIRSIGGRLAASNLDIEFYSQFGSAKALVRGIMKDMKDKGQKSSQYLCPRGGPLTFERSEDEKIGYGYFVSTDAAALSLPASNISPTRRAPPKTAPAPEKRHNLSWPLYNYVQHFLKSELDQVVCNVSPNLLLTLVPPKSGLPSTSPCVCLEYKPQDDGDDNDQMTSSLLQSAFDQVRQRLDELSVRAVGDFNVSREDVLGDPDIKSFKSINKLFTYVRKVAQLSDQRDDRDSSVIMDFPNTWCRSSVHSRSGPGRGGPARGRGAGAGRGRFDDTYTVARVQQFLFNEFNIKEMDYDCKIGRHPSTHACLTFRRPAHRNTVLSYESDTVSFQPNSFQNRAEGLNTIERVSISIVYPRNKEAAAEELVNQIRGLERDEMVVDLFPQVAYSQSDFFFNDRHWAIIREEAEQRAPSVIVELMPATVGQVRKIHLFGLKTRLNVVEEFLKDRAKSLLFKKIPIPDAVRSDDLKDALRDTLKRVNNQYIVKKRFKVGKDKDDEADDNSGTGDGESKCSGLSQNDSDGKSSRMKIAGSTYDIHRELRFFSVVAFPESSDLWSAQCTSGLELVSSFHKVSLALNGYRAYGKTLKQTFGLLGCVYDKRTDSITLTGLKDRVDSAVQEVIQLKAGGARTTEYLSFDSYTRADMIIEFLRLPGSKEHLGQIRDDIMSRFSNIKAAVLLGGDRSEKRAMMLSGTQQVMTGSGGALSAAHDALRSLVSDLKLSFFPLPERELNWLKDKAFELRSTHNALIDFITSSDDDAFDSHQLRAKCSMSSCEVSVACCDLRDTSVMFGCDAIVNSANGQLHHGGGIALALADIAGPNFTKECTQLVNDIGTVGIGHAVITSGHDLASIGLRHVIHAVAPNLQGLSLSPHSRLNLRQCVMSALSKAHTAGIESIAVPGIGTGLYGWPMKVAVAEMILAISQWAAEHSNTRMKILLFDKDSETVDAFTDSLSALSQGSLALEMPSAPRSVIDPGDRPPPPSHMWFWQVWRWELESPENASKVVELKLKDGTVIKVIPYDYDQVMKLERARELGATTVDIAGDIGGMTNSSRYTISLTEMTQTTNPKRNEHSCRPIYRKKISPAKASRIPLYDQRCSEYESSVASFRAQAGRFQAPALALPADLNTSMCSGPADDDNNSFNSYASIFGPRGDMAGIMDGIRSFINKHTVREMICLDLLKRRNNGLMVFDALVVELKDLLADYDVSIVSQNPASWGLEIEALGMIPLLEAKNEINTFEKRKIANLSRIELPRSWGYGDIDEDDNPEPELIPLRSSDDDYREASDCFLEKGYRGRIVRIERIQNVELYRHYQKMKMQIANWNNGDSNQMLLKHGTRSLDPAVIWQASPSKESTYAFDFRHASDNNFYGRGAYFSDAASYSEAYSYNLPTGEKQMFLAYVAAGRHEQREDIDRTIKKPAPSCQSVRGQIKTGQYGIVVYELTQSYPAYLVTFIPPSV